MYVLFFFEVSLTKFLLLYDTTDSNTMNQDSIRHV